MRGAFADAVVSQASDENTVFLTGDLGFMALEPVREAFGDRFVNVGVAEQNMISTAAGIARTGMRVYAYSIASFASMRAVEQMKVDVASQGLSVCLVGNGGGYAYGHMGPTHHALDDIAVMNAIGVTALIPAFDHEVTRIVDSWKGPTYLRLGRQESNVTVIPPVSGSDSLTPLLVGDSSHLIALGPLAGLALETFRTAPASDRPTVWECSKLPLGELPEVLADIDRDCPVAVFEEHVAAGGLGQQLAYAWMRIGRAPRLTHSFALGYPSGRYGSQAFHRQECALDTDRMRAWWNSANAETRVSAL